MSINFIMLTNSELLWFINHLNQFDLLVKSFKLIIKDAILFVSFGLNRFKLSF